MRCLALTHSKWYEVKCDCFYVAIVVSGTSELRYTRHVAQAPQVLNSIIYVHTSHKRVSSHPLLLSPLSSSQLKHGHYPPLSQATSPSPVPSPHHVVTISIAPRPLPHGTPVGRGGASHTPPPPRSGPSIHFYTLTSAPIFQLAPSSGKRRMHSRT